MKSDTSIYTGFEFEVEGFPASAIINTSLKQLENREAYPVSVFIMIMPDNYDENGHPDEAEFEYLNQVEKEIISYLENQTRTVHVGHTTIYRARQIIFYTRDQEQVETFLEHYLGNVERESEVEIIADPQWENVSAFYELI